MKKILLIIGIIGILLGGVFVLGYKDFIAEAQINLGCVPQPILPVVADKIGQERIELVSDMIVNDSCFGAGMYVYKGVRIEIESIEDIEGGIAVVARAWVSGATINYYRKT